jgi:hypothetical protein
MSGGVFRPGNVGNRYIDRCSQDLICICEERGDNRVYIDGQGPYCVIIDEEYTKVNLGDVGINAKTIEAVWPTTVDLPIKRHSQLVSGQFKYVVAESPRRLEDGWTAAKLQTTCEC